MDHVIEPAASGRAKCRGCGAGIAKGELRLGERLPNPFTGEGVMTHWFHLGCAAFKRPEVVLATLPDTPQEVPKRDALIESAQLGVAHRRLPRIDGVERAPTARARCRDCREPIARDDWRIRLVFHDEGQFNPSGFLHIGCAGSYLGTGDVLDRLTHFTPELSPEDGVELRELLGA